jgi:hypothetical protein
MSAKQQSVDQVVDNDEHAKGSNGNGLTLQKDIPASGRRRTGKASKEVADEDDDADEAMDTNNNHSHNKNKNDNNTDNNNNKSLGKKRPLMLMRSFGRKSVHAQKSQKTQKIGDGSKWLWGLGKTKLEKLSLRRRTKRNTRAAQNNRIVARMAGAFNSQMSPSHETGGTPRQADYTPFYLPHTMFNILKQVPVNPVTYSNLMQRQLATIKIDDDRFDYVTVENALKLFTWRNTQADVCWESCIRLLVYLLGLGSPDMSTTLPEIVAADTRRYPEKDGRILFTEDGELKYRPCAIKRNHFLASHSVHLKFNGDVALEQFKIDLAGFKFRLWLNKVSPHIQLNHDNILIGLLNVTWHESDQPGFVFSEDEAVVENSAEVGVDQDKEKTVDVENSAEVVGDQDKEKTVDESLEATAESRTVDKSGDEKELEADFEENRENCNQTNNASKNKNKNKNDNNNRSGNGGVENVQGLTEEEQKLQAAFKARDKYRKDHVLVVVVGVHGVLLIDANNFTADVDLRRGFDSLSSWLAQTELARISAISFWPCARHMTIIPPLIRKSILDDRPATNSAAGLFRKELFDGQLALSRGIFAIRLMNNFQAMADFVNFLVSTAHFCNLHRVLVEKMLGLGCVAFESYSKAVECVRVCVAGAVRHQQRKNTYWKACNYSQVWDNGGHPTSDEEVSQILSRCSINSDRMEKLGAFFAFLLSTDMDINGNDTGRNGFMDAHSVSFFQCDFVQFIFGLNILEIDTGGCYHLILMHSETDLLNPYRKTSPMAGGIARTFQIDTEAVSRQHRHLPISLYTPHELTTTIYTTTNLKADLLKCLVSRTYIKCVVKKLGLTYLVSRDRNMLQHEQSRIMHSRYSDSSSAFADSQDDSEESANRDTDDAIEKKSSDKPPRKKRKVRKKKAGNAQPAGPKKKRKPRKKKKKKKKGLPTH